MIRNSIWKPAILNDSVQPFPNHFYEYYAESIEHCLLCNNFWKPVAIIGGGNHKSLLIRQIISAILM